MQRARKITHTTLVDQSYWDTGYAGMRPMMAPTDDVVRQWMETTIPKALGEQHALEVGCFPGRYLAVLGLMGYVVHGVDRTPAVDRMKAAFDTMGLRTGEFTQADFLAHRPVRNYDLVCSFGFIEHFTDWRGVLARHADHVEPGGLLVIGTPNFRGWVQHLLHWCLDATNLRRHHLGAMVPSLWADVLLSQGFEVIMQGHVGRFEFWSDSPPPNVFQRAIGRALRWITPTLRSVPPGNAALSPYAVLIARKKIPAPPVATDA